MRRKETPFKRTALVDIGERLPIRLPILTRRLNRLQKSYEFTVAEPITLEKLGPPGDNAYYSTKRLHDEVAQHPQRSTVDFLIGITNLKMTDPDEPINSAERAYFSSSNLDGIGVVSTHGDVLSFKPLLKDDYQYVAYLIMCEVLVNQTRTRLYHPEPDACLFHDCEDRSELRDCMDAGQISDKCRSILKEKGVSNFAIADVQNVLNWCKRNTLPITIRHFLNNPWVVALLVSLLTPPLIWLIVFLVQAIRSHP